ncbi:MAG: NAD+ synthase, partial [Thermoplasmata archaeon]
TRRAPLGRSITASSNMRTMICRRIRTELLHDCQQKKNMSESLFMSGSFAEPMALTPKFKREFVKVIERFIRDYLRESGRKGIIIAMSGGLDSSVVAALCARSVGPERTAGLHLPYRDSPKQDERDARELANSLGISFNSIPIDDLVEAFLALEDTEDRVRRGNIIARCRMVVLYHAAHSMDHIVAGTSNKSELLVGYFTKYGDGASDIAPIGDLYKTQVRGLAKELGIPEHVLEKTPSAALWPGQSDEEELGISYDELDPVLLGIELGFNAEDIVERTGLDAAKVDRIVERVEKSVHKRRLGLIPKVGISTVGLDWRE